MRSLVQYKDFGNVSLVVGKIMREKDISISKMVKMTGLHYNVVQRYFDNLSSRYDAEALAKFCYVLECDIADILLKTLTCTVDINHL